MNADLKLFIEFSKARGDKLLQRVMEKLQGLDPVGDGDSGSGKAFPFPLQTGSRRILIYSLRDNDQLVGRYICAFNNRVAKYDIAINMKLSHVF